MSLRKRAWLIISLTTLGLILVLYTLLQLFWLSSYAEMEQQHTRQEMEQGRDQLAKELNRLSMTAEDWASWDDTYSFVAGNNSEFISVNLMDSTFTTLHLDLMVFLDKNDWPVLAKAVDLTAGRETTFPRGLMDYLANRAVPGYWPRRAGVLMLPEGPLLVAAQPILTSFGQGPSRGTLVMGRFMTPAQLNMLTPARTGTLALYSIDQPELPAEVRRALACLSPAEPVCIRRLDNSRLVGYTLISDLDGQPVLLRLETESTYRYAQTAINYYVVSLLGAGVIFGGLILLMLERQVLSRLRNLGHDVTAIAANGHPAARVNLPGNDELDALARQINLMLASIEQATAELEQRNRELALLAADNAHLYEQASQDAFTKTTLLQEVNHRVKNNLTAIIGLMSVERQHTSMANEPAFQGVMNNLSQRVRAMATAHNLLSANEWRPVRLTSLVSDAVQVALSMVPRGQRLHLDITPAPLLVSPRQATPLALVAAELASNIVKHGLAGRPNGGLVVRVADLDNGAVELQFHDDGPGYPEQVLLGKQRNVGLYLVETLVRSDLRGTVTFHNDGGAVTTIHFKAEPATEPATARLLAHSGNGSSASTTGQNAAGKPAPTLSGRF